MKRAVVKLQTRLPVKLHARLKKAAQTNKCSLHAEMLDRLEARPGKVDAMMERIEEHCLDLMQWARDEIVRVLAASLHDEIKTALVRVLRDLRNGDVPVLVNEELARINRDVLRSEVRAAMNE